MLRETEKVEAHLSLFMPQTFGANMFVSLFRPSRSSIALVDADPGSDRRKRAAYAESYSDQVAFLPEEAYRKANDEL